MSVDDFIICTDPFLQKILANKGIDATVFDKVLTSQEKKSILEQLEKFASEWFVDKKGKDYTTYRGVSIGAALHDEVLTFFHLLARFLFILEKVSVGNKKIVLYQSQSCLMPDHIVQLIEACGGEVVTTNDKYLYLSYQQMFFQEIGSSYSYVSYSFYKEDRINSKKQSRGLRIFLKQIISKCIYRIFVNRKKKFIFFMGLRNLIPFYKRYFEEQNVEYGIMLAHNSYSDPEQDRRQRGFFQDLLHVYQLTKKDVIFDSLKPCSLNQWGVSYRKKEEFKSLIEKFSAYFDMPFDVKNQKLTDFFNQSFQFFYKENLSEILRLIDFYYKKFSSKKIKLSLQEVVHPLQAQVMGQLKKNCYLYPANIVIHNQYFTKRLLDQTSPYYKVLANSAYDCKRYEAQGFKKGDVCVIDTELKMQLKKQLRPYTKVENLKNSKVLVLPPFIPCLHTFRQLIESDHFVNYLKDVLFVLEKFEVAEVMIRPHPVQGFYNQFGCTEMEFYKNILNSYDCEWNINVQVSDSKYANFYDDIEQCDLVVSTVSGSILQVLVRGKDFVFFDRSISPHAGTKDRTVLNEEDGVVNRIKDKESLQEHFMSYEPLDRDLFLKKYFDNFEKTRPLEEEINAIV